mmetsp:Transcript_19926/g.40277  ORF Transcript_19926/g.40277 Transcript_19926/m.40277 type:complete len:154 (-) Transcript_19926:260-721(-)|eukprot:CAMPEP_0167771314 /NCGR_PEP_ID=MMETSP0111_2-20121227/210_1 /TAXON_ID=91324 /ORGANISM="Lotharella globosa, Strain CCCM811" /LENGTH=153 /DNA_ID=CAMNT_0007660655 /DNA_START=114 /DNA_END=575 /DNA_ORIENTATION=+
MEQKIKIPRSFKLLEEYDYAVGKENKTKISGQHKGLINYGLMDYTRESKDPLGSWRGIIIGIQGKQSGELLYNFEISIPKNYPDAAPIVRFKGPKMDMPAIDSRGYVNLSRLPGFTWTADKWIADVLMEIRKNMNNPICLRTSTQRAREGNYF